MPAATKTAESKEIKDARKALEKCQRNLNAAASRVAATHAEWYKALLALDALEMTAEPSANGDDEHNGG